MRQIAAKSFAIRLRSWAYQQSIIEVIVALAGNRATSHLINMRMIELNGTVLTHGHE